MYTGVFFDNALYVGANTSGSNVSFTTGNLNGGYMLLYVGVGNGKTVTTCTYNGVSATLVDSQAISPANEIFFLYKLANPTAGTNNIVVASSDGSTYDMAVATYGNVSAIATVAKNGNLNSPISASVTPTTNNAWVTGFFRNSTGSFVAGAGTTLRVSTSSIICADNNAIVNPAAATTLNLTFSGGGVCGYIACSLVPLQANKFWVGGTGTWDGSSTTHWSTSSGGSSGASVPSSSDIVQFDNNSGTGTVTLGANVSCAAVDFTLYAGTFSFSTYTLTLAAATGLISGLVWNPYVGMTVTAGTGTIKITDATSTAKIFYGGGFTYPNLWITGSGTGAYTIRGDNTFLDFKVDTPPHTVNFQSFSTQTVQTFTVSGTAGNLMTLQSSSSGNPWFLKKSTTGTVSCDYLSLQDSYVR